MAALATVTLNNPIELLTGRCQLLHESHAIGIVGAPVIARKHAASHFPGRRREQSEWWRPRAEATGILDHGRRLGLVSGPSRYPNIAV